MNEDLSRLDSQTYELVQLAVKMHAFLAEERYDEKWGRWRDPVADSYAAYTEGASKRTQDLLYALKKLKNLDQNLDSYDPKRQSREIDRLAREVVSA